MNLLQLIKRGLILCAVLALLTYATLFVVCAFFSNRILFSPSQTPHEDEPGTLKLKSAEGNLISAIYLPHENARFTLLYSHGNGEDIVNLRPLLENLADLGINVLAYDYQGYGTSQGQPTERHIYEDEQAAFTYLTSERRIPPTQIILFGQGLGSGPAIDLASRQPVGGLIAAGSFLSAFRVVTRWPVLPFDRFNNIEKIRSVHCPVLVMHGREDDYVPMSQAQALYDAANQPKQFAWIDKAHHADLDDQDAFYGAIGDFGKLVAQAQTSATKPVGTQR